MLLTTTTTKRKILLPYLLTTLAIANRCRRNPPTRRSAPPSGNHTKLAILIKSFVTTTTAQYPTKTSNWAYQEILRSPMTTTPTHMGTKLEKSAGLSLNVYLATKNAIEKERKKKLSIKKSFRFPLGVETAHSGLSFPIWKWKTFVIRRNGRQIERGKKNCFVSSLREKEAKRLSRKQALWPKGRRNPPSPRQTRNGLFDPRRNDTIGAIPIDFWEEFKTFLFFLLFWPCSQNPMSIWRNGRKKKEKRKYISQHNANKRRMSHAVEHAVGWRTYRRTPRDSRQPVSRL